MQMLNGSFAKKCIVYLVPDNLGAKFCVNFRFIFEIWRHQQITIFLQILYGERKKLITQPYDFIKRRKPGVSKPSTKIYPISFRRKTFRVFIFAIFGRHETKIVINAFILLNFICQSSFYVKTTYEKIHLIQYVIYLNLYYIQHLVVLKSEDFVSRCTYLYVV